MPAISVHVTVTSMGTHTSSGIIWGDETTNERVNKV